MPVEHCPECQRYVESSRPDHAVTCSRLSLSDALFFLSIRVKQMTDEEAVNRTVIRNLHERIHGLEQSEQIVKTNAMAWREEYERVIKVVTRELHGLVPKTHLIDSIVMTCRIRFEQSERSEAMRRRRDEAEAALLPLVSAVSEWHAAWVSSTQCDPSRDGSGECQRRRTTLDMKSTELGRIFAANVLPKETLKLLAIRDAAGRWAADKRDAKAELELLELVNEEG